MSINVRSLFKSKVSELKVLINGHIHLRSRTAFYLTSNIHLPHFLVPLFKERFCPIETEGSFAINLLNLTPISLTTVLIFLLLMSNLCVLILLFLYMDITCICLCLLFLLHCHFSLQKRLMKVKVYQGLSSPEIWGWGGGRADQWFSIHFWTLFLKRQHPATNSHLLTIWWVEDFFIYQLIQAS